MSAVSLSTIRSRFATVVDALTGFSESRNPWGGASLRQPQSVAQLRFSVGISSTMASDESRQIASVGVPTLTNVVVMFNYRLRPKDQITDYDAALNEAETVMRALTVRASPLHDNLQIRFDSMTPRISSSGEYMELSLSFLVLHELSLS